LNEECKVIPGGGPVAAFIDGILQPLRQGSAPLQYRSDVNFFRFTFIYIRLILKQNTSERVLSARPTNRNNQLALIVKRFPGMNAPINSQT
jgi:hypothetical protein